MIPGVRSLHATREREQSPTRVAEQTPTERTQVWFVGVLLCLVLTAGNTNDAWAAGADRPPTSHPLPDVRRRISGKVQHPRITARRSQRESMFVYLAAMWPMALPFETWRAIIDWLRNQDAGVASYRRHADELERILDQTPADQAIVHLNLRDELFLASVNWACMALGIGRPMTRE